MSTETSVAIAKRPLESITAVSAIYGCPWYVHLERKKTGSEVSLSMLTHLPTLLLFAILLFNSPKNPFTAISVVSAVSVE